MAQADRYPFLQFGVGQSATIAGATTVLVTLAAAPTGLPNTTIRVLNNSTYAPIGSVALVVSFLALDVGRKRHTAYAIENY